MIRLLHILDKVVQYSNPFATGMMIVAIAFGFFLLGGSVRAAPNPNEPHEIELPKIYPGPPSALLCWLVVWLNWLVIYAILPDPSAYWIVLLLDGFGNAALVAAAVCLLGDDKAPPVWKFLAYILSGSLVLLCWNLLIGSRVPSDYLAWRIIVSLPGLLLAAGAFIYLAVTASKRFARLRRQIWLMCFVYALLQFPAYIYFLMLSAPNSLQGKLTTGLLGVGKIMFVLLFLSILLIEMEIVEKDSAIKRIKKFLPVIQLTLSVVAIVVRLLK